MLTLDELLSQRALEIFSGKLSLDQTLWTKENRDEKALEVKEVTRQTVDEAMVLTKNAFETLVEDKPLLYWIIYEQVLLSELDYWTSLRQEIDTGLMVEGAPFDYLWLGEKILGVFESGKKVRTHIDQGLSPNNAIQEL